MSAVSRLSSEIKKCIQQILEFVCYFGKLKIYHIILKYDKTVFKFHFKKINDS